MGSQDGRHGGVSLQFFLQQSLWNSRTVLFRTEPCGPARQFQYLLPPPCPPRDAGDGEFKWNEDVEATRGLILVHEA